MSQSDTDFTAMWTVLQRDVDLPGIAELVDRPSWHSDAACRGVGPDIFFGQGRPSTRRAFQLCGGCPVQHQCRAAAQEVSLDYGIWGGTTAADRLKEIRVADTRLTVVPARSEVD